MYAGFRAAGIGYGPAYQVVGEVRHGAGEALALLTGPAATAVGVALLDGALQTVAVLVEESATGPAVPFALASCDVYGPSVAATGGFVPLSTAISTGSGSNASRSYPLSDSTASTVVL